MGHMCVHVTQSNPTEYMQYRPDYMSWIPLWMALYTHDTIGTQTSAKQDRDDLR